MDPIDRAPHATAHAATVVTNASASSTTLRTIFVSSKGTTRRATISRVLSKVVFLPSNAFFLSVCLTFSVFFSKSFFFLDIFFFQKKKTKKSNKKSVSISIISPLAKRVCETLTTTTMAPKRWSKTASAGRSFAIVRDVSLSRPSCA